MRVLYQPALAKIYAMLSALRSSVAFLLFVFLTSTAISQSLDWSNMYSGTLMVKPASTAVDDDGNVYATGTYRGNVNFSPGVPGFSESSTGGTDDIFVTKHAQDGSLLWVVSLGSFADDGGSDIAINANGEIIVSGYFRTTISYTAISGTGSISSQGSEDAFVLRLTSDGQIIDMQSFGGPANVVATSVTADSDGNVYIAGWFLGDSDFNPGSSQHILSSAGMRDVFVLKLDDNGDFVWAQHYGGPENDSPTEIVHAQNSLFLSGTFRNTADFSGGLGTGILNSQGLDDAFLLKISDDGDFDWVNAAHDAQSCTIRGLAVQSNGNVRVVGDFDSELVINIPGNTINIPTWGGSDVFLGQINSGGEWESVIRLGSIENDRGWGVALNSTDELYVSMSFGADLSVPSGDGLLNSELSTQTGAAIIKYNPSNELLWYRQLTGSSELILSSISLDAESSVIISGDFEGLVEYTFEETSHTSAGGSNGFVARYEECGSHTYSVQETTTCHFYITEAYGWKYEDSGIYLDILPNSAGCDSVVTFHLEILEGPVVNVVEFICDSLVSPSGSAVYTEAGEYVDFVPAPSGCDTLYNINVKQVFGTESCTNQYFDWVNGFEGSSSVTSNEVVVDLEGNSYVLGDFFGTINPDPEGGFVPTQSLGSTDVFLSKYNSAGKHIWTKFIQSPSTVTSHALAFDINGFLYLTGSFFNTVDIDPGPGVFEIEQSNGRAFVVKLNLDGAFIWGKQFGSSATTNPNALAVSHDSEVYIAGQFTQSGDFDPGQGVVVLTSQGGFDMFFMKLDQGGNLVWAFRRGNTSTPHNVNGLAVDIGGSVYATGAFFGSINLNPGGSGGNHSSAGTFNNLDAFVLKLSPAGSHLWSRRYGGGSADEGKAITTDWSGNVLFTGMFTGSTPSATFGSVTLTHGGGQINGFITKVSSSGTVVWARKIVSVTSENAEGLGIATDAANNVYVTGYRTVLGSSANRFIYFTKRNPSNGLSMQTQWYGTSGFNLGRSIQADWAGNVYITGGFLNTVDFVHGEADYELTALNSSDGFLLKMKTDTLISILPIRQMTGIFPV